MRSRRDDKPKGRPRKPVPEELARDAVAHEEASPGPGDRVRMTFRVVLPRSVAETLVARAIRDEKNIGTLVTEILEAAAKKGNG
jgi:hypothetical protein